MISKFSPPIEGAYRFSIAPMLDCTDRHFRVLIRQISKRALVYTEMVVAQALYHSQKREHLLGFDSVEHPISLQVAGDEPKILAEAARMAESWGYDEINLNVGCPSKRVQSGNFGACLMASPEQVASCVESMSKASQLPVTVKHRLGIDELDNEEHLLKFVDQVSKAGAKRFAVHARKAWLEGLNPKQNRKVSPLQHERVALLKQKRPGITIELNGGLSTPIDCLNALKTCDGAMVGRAVYEHPLRWKSIDELIYQEAPKVINASEIVRGMIPYAETHLLKNGRMWDICRHLLQVVEGVPGAKSWRRNLSCKAQKAKANLQVLEEAAVQLENLGL